MKGLKKNTRLRELDILRAISFIFVVEQHSMGGYFNIKGISYTYYKFFKFFYSMAKPAVPSFLCISGILLFIAYSEKFDWRKYYIKRIKFVILPYAIWSVIYVFRSGKYAGILNLLGQIVSGDACYHFWYMGMVIRLYLYFPIILYISRKVHNSKGIFRIIVFITLVIGYFYISKYQNVISRKVIETLFTNPSKLQSKFINVSPLFWYLYFIIGIYIGMNYQCFKKWILKLKVPVILVYIFLFSYSYLNGIKIVEFNRCLSLSYCVFTILFWYLLSLKLSNKMKIYNFFNFISKYSFGAYMIHIFTIQRIAGYLMGHIQLKDWVVIGLILWIASSLISPFVIKLITYVPYSQLLTGISKKRNNLKNVEVSQ